MARITVPEGGEQQRRATAGAERKRPGAFYRWRWPWPDETLPSLVFLTLEREGSDGWSVPSGGGVVDQITLVPLHLAQCLASGVSSGLMLKALPRNSEGETAGRTYIL